MYEYCARMENYGKTHQIEEWMTHSGCSEELKTFAHAMFFEAQPAAVYHYDIRIEDGNL
jgi:hypothetical protein